MKFSDTHLCVLRKTISETRAPWRGRVPIEWFNAILNTPDTQPREEILKELKLVGSCRLKRQQLREICRDKSKDVLVAYICTMAWGAQGGGKTIDNARDAWARRDAIAKRLHALRTGKLTRAAAYELFTDTNCVRGLGSAYFTKLIFFFSPLKNNYIMDQWTAKSMLLLTGKTDLLRMTGSWPSRSNAGEDYSRFCEAIDCLAAELKLPGDETEELIFSIGGKGAKAGIWRRHVRDHWPESARANR